MNYYSIPFRLDKVIKGKHMDDEVDLRAAIHQNIHLILKTYTLSYRFDPTFGCVMNKYHAATPPQKVSEKKWRDSIREDVQSNLLDMFQRYESRVKVDEVIVNIKTSNNISKAHMVMLDIQVNGQLTIGRNELFHYPDSEVSDDAQEVFPLMIPVGKGGR